MLNLRLLKNIILLMKIDKRIAKNAILKLLKFTKLLHSNDEATHRAFTSNFSDFEDDLMYSLAETYNMNPILTDSNSDFSGSAVPVYHQDDFNAFFR